MTEKLTKPLDIAALAGKIAELRVISGPDSETPETELPDCRFPVRILDVLPFEDTLRPLVGFEFLDHAFIPLPAGRWLDLFVDGARIARLDVLHLTKHEPAGLSSLVVHTGSHFRIGVDP